MKYLFELLIVSLLSLCSFRETTASRWASGDPLPPNQPKEVIIRYTEVNNYTYPEKPGVQRLLTEFNSIQIQSYAKSAIYTTGAGLNMGDPLFSWAFQNYTDPLSPTASCQCQYSYQTCGCNIIEGGTAFYAGYDYYTNLLLAQYAMGVPIYFYERNDSQFGPMLVYDIVMPWNDTVYPRYLNYSVQFEKESGLCRYYELHGTEYCCENAALGCLEQGERKCRDGSNILLTYASTKLTFYDYQNISKAPAFPDNFFGNYYPSFPSMVSTPVYAGFIFLFLPILSN
jgi:hypothetical protein